MGRVSEVIAFVSVCVLVSVVQHTSISTEFPNNSWRYVALYAGVTGIIRRADWGNTLTERD